LLVDDLAQLLGRQSQDFPCLAPSLWLTAGDHFIAMGQSTQPSVHPESVNE